MVRIEAHALALKGADLKQVFHGMKGGIPVKVHHSTTPQSEKCTDPKLARQWNSIDWKEIEYRVNRLQTRIAKATKDKNGIWLKD